MTSLTPTWRHAARPRPSVHVQPHGKAVNALAFTPDGAHLVSASEDGTVRVLRASDGAEVGQLLGHRGPVNRLALAPDGATLFTAGDDGRVLAWDLAPARGRSRDRPVTGSFFECLAAMKGGHHHLRDVAAGPRVVVGASENRNVYVWDAATGVLLRELRGHAEKLSAVALSPDERTAISVSLDHETCVWDVASGASRGLFYGEKSHVFYVAGMYFPLPNRTGHGHEAPPRYFRFLRDGRMVSAGDALLVWDTARKAELARVDTGWGFDGLDVLERDGAPIRVATGSSHVAVYEVDGEGDATRLRRVYKGPGPGGHVKAVALSPDGAWVASANDKGAVVIAAAAQGDAAAAGHVDRVHNVAIDVHSGRVATGDFDATTCLWSLTDGAHVATLDVHPSSGERRLAFAPDGHRLVTVGDAPRLHVWDARTGAAVRSVQWPEASGRDPGVATFAVGARAERAVVAPTRGPLTVWPLDGGEPFALEGESAITSELTWDGADRYAVMLGYYGPPGDDDYGRSVSHLECWDLVDKKRVWVVDATKDGSFGAPLRVAGRVYAGTGEEDRIGAYDVRTGALLATFEPLGYLADGAVTPTGEAVFLISREDDDGYKHHVWHVDPERSALTAAHDLGRGYHRSALAPCGTLLAGAIDAELTIFALDAAAPRTVGTYAADEPITGVACARHGHDVHVVAGLASGRALAFQLNHPVTPAVRAAR